MAAAAVETATAAAPPLVPTTTELPPHTAGQTDESTAKHRSTTTTATTATTATTHTTIRCSGPHRCTQRRAP